MRRSPIKNKRQIKCKVCKAEFYRFKTTQIVCGPGCAIEYGQQQLAKREQQAAKDQRKKDRAWKEANKKHGQLAQEAQRAVNDFVRERDWYEPCISCGRENLADPLTGGAWDAGHFFTVGAHPNLRFDIRNNHKQCKYCNRDLGGNPQEYERRLIEIHGKEKVEALKLEFWQAPPLNATKDDLRAIRDLTRLVVNHMRRVRRDQNP